MNLNDRNNISNVENELSVHEAVCAERYKQIIERQEWFQTKINKIEHMVLILIIVVVATNPMLLQFFGRFL